MNARAIKKRLMRGRANVFWGKRAYLSVRMPRSVVDGIIPTEPCPEGFTPDPEWEGTWVTPDGLESIRVCKSGTGVKPDPEDEELFGPHETVASVEETPHGTWDIWSGSRTRKVMLPDGSDYEWEPSDSKVSADFILAYKAYSEWKERLYGEDLSPLVTAFNEAGYSAKSTHWKIEPDGLVVRYGVKWFYAYRKFRFCTDLSKAVTAARLAGKKVKLLRG